MNNINYLGLKGLTPKEIHEDMVVTLGEDAPSYSMVMMCADPNRFLKRYCDHGWDLGPSLPTRDEATIKAVEIPRFSVFQGSHACDARGQGDGLHFLRCRRSAVGGLPRQGSHYHGSLLCSSFETATEEHSSRFVVESWQEECSSIRTMHRHTRPQWPWLLSRNADSNLLKTHPILLTWLSDYYLLTKMKKELCGHHFVTDDDAMNAVYHFLRDLNDTIYTEGIRLSTPWPLD